MTALTAAPPDPAVRSRAARLRAPLLSAAGLAAVTYALRVRDPHVAHSWGVCPLYALTGVYCPGCGGLRAVNDLTHGHVHQAASSNLLLLAAIPLVVVCFGRAGYAAWTGRDVSPVPLPSRVVTYGVIGVVLVFTILRNLPGSWLAP
jgi:hypothetical protein